MLYIHANIHEWFKVVSAPTPNLSELGLGLELQAPLESDGASGSTGQRCVPHDSEPRRPGRMSLQLQSPSKST